MITISVVPSAEDPKPPLVALVQTETMTQNKAEPSLSALRAAAPTQTQEPGPSSGIHVQVCRAPCSAPASTALLTDKAPRNEQLIQAASQGDGAAVFICFLACLPNPGS